MKKVFFMLTTLYLSVFAVGVARAVELEVSYPSAGGEEFAGGGPIAWLEYLFTGAFALIGIVAFISLVVAGIQWMTSRNPGSISDAKDRITGTILGLVLAGASVLILQLINPDLVNLSIPSIVVPDTLNSSEQQGGAGNNNTSGFGNACTSNEDCESQNPLLYCGKAEVNTGTPTGSCRLKQDTGSCTSDQQCVSGRCEGLPSQQLPEARGTFTGECVPPSQPARASIITIDAPNSLFEEERGSFSFLIEAPPGTQGVLIIRWPNTADGDIGETVEINIPQQGSFEVVRSMVWPEGTVGEHEIRAVFSTSSSDSSTETTHTIRIKNRFST